MLRLKSLVDISDLWHRALKGTRLLSGGGRQAERSELFGANGFRYLRNGAVGLILRGYSYKYTQINAAEMRAAQLIS